MLVHFAAFLALFVSSLTSSLTFAAVTEPAPNKALHALFEREFQLGLAESPESATFIGVDGFDLRKALIPALTLLAAPNELPKVWTL